MVNLRKRNNDNGLYYKYQVSRVDRPEEEVNGYFVLRLKDPAAREAIRKYVEEIGNEILKKDLLEWVNEFEDLKCIDYRRGYCKKVDSPVCCAHCKRRGECYDEGDMKCSLVLLGIINNIDECKNYFGYLGSGVGEE